MSTDLDALFEQTAAEQEQSDVWIDPATGLLYYLNDAGQLQGFEGGVYDAGHELFDRVRQPLESADDDAYEELMMAARTIGQDIALRNRWQAAGIEDLTWHEIAVSYEWLRNQQAEAKVRQAAGELEPPTIDQLNEIIKRCDALMVGETEKWLAAYLNEEATVTWHKKTGAVQSVEGWTHASYVTMIGELEALEIIADAKKHSVESTKQSKKVKEQYSKIEPKLPEPVSAPDEDAAEEAAQALGLTREQAFAFTIDSQQAADWFVKRVNFWQHEIDDLITMCGELLLVAVKRRARLLMAFGRQHKDWTVAQLDRDDKGKVIRKSHKTLAGGTFFRKVSEIFVHSNSELTQHCERVFKEQTILLPRANIETLRHQLSNSPELLALIDDGAYTQHPGFRVRIQPLRKYWTGCVKTGEVVAGYGRREPDEFGQMGIGTDKAWSVNETFKRLRDIASYRVAIPVANERDTEDDEDEGDG